MNTFDRIKWMNYIEDGIAYIKLAHHSGVLSNETYIKWTVIRRAELAWNEFYMPTIKLNK